MNTLPTAVTGSHFADLRAARQALSMASPMIEAAIQDRRVCGAGFLHVVVMDPALRPGEVPFEAAILLEKSLGGDPSGWDADYAAFARAKARVTWQASQGSHVLQAGSPHLLREGDSLLWGSACLDGIVVGVSGAEAWYDEAFATAIAACLRAVAKERHAAARAAGAWTAGAEPRG